MSSAPLSIVVSGVGGQGTVLSAKLLAECALAGGAYVRSAETIGMAQRGGIVLGHVRIVFPYEGAGSDTDKAGGLGSSGKLRSARADQLACLSPLVPLGRADLLIGFEPGETLRTYRYCKPGASVITATNPLVPPTAAVKKVKYDGKAQLAVLEQQAAEGRIAHLVQIESSAVIAEIGFDKALNVVLLGAALGVLKESDSPYAPLLSYKAMQNTIQATVKERFVELNLKALEMGYNIINHSMV